MSTPASFTAIVPMRHHSERVHEKNYRSFSGKPLYTYILDTLSEVKQINTIVVDTDSPTIERGVQSHYPKIVLLRRPESLRGGEVPMNDVLLNSISRLDGEHFLQTHSTNPLVRAETFESAIKEYLANWPEHDSLFSVTRHQSRFWSPEGEPLNHDPSTLIKTQDLPGLMEENSSIYIFSRQVLESRKVRIGASPLLFEMDALEGWDIDDDLDFVIAEFLHSAIHQEN